LRRPSVEHRERRHRVEWTRAHVDFVAKPEPTVIHSHDVTSSKGALYLRVAVRGFSRYEGSGEDEPDVDSRLVPSEEKWVRTIVPCRWDADEVPAPHVKLVVPLTRPLQATHSAAPLLAVLDEPWGDAGGLGEQLLASIADAELPKTDGTIREAGPDPILSVTPVDVTNLRLPNPIGPIGYTFDSDTDAPLFVRSSFIIPPPTGLPADTDLGWWSVKLQFIRKLIATPDSPQYVNLPPPAPALRAG
jgi:hypothetical protein